jgi:hypothetical protein
VTYRHHNAINERYTFAFAEDIEFHEQHRLKEYTRHEFYKATIGGKATLL